MKTIQKKHKKISEQEFLDTIDIIAKKLGYKFKFGYHEIEDMKQQISVFALEGLQNYDYKRPLENFLWTHVRNRLFNFKRDNYQRPDKPCKSCPLYDKLCGDIDNDCLEFKNKLDCSMYKNWYIRNNVKKNLMYLNTIEELKEYLPTIKGKSSSLEDAEFIAIIEENLYGFYREIYLKLKLEIKIPNKDLLKLSEKIQEIFND